jgi:hypothetical protein
LDLRVAEQKGGFGTRDVGFSKGGPYLVIALVNESQQEFLKGQVDSKSPVVQIVAELLLCEQDLLLVKGPGREEDH